MGIRTFAAAVAGLLLLMLALSYGVFSWRSGSETRLKQQRIAQSNLAALREDAEENLAALRLIATKQQAAATAVKAAQQAKASQETQLVAAIGDWGLWEGEPGDKYKSELGDTACRRDALQWMKGRSIVMLGDSLMRYQYLSLVYWIEHGRWILNRRVVDLPNPCREPDYFGDWITDGFLQALNISRGNNPTMGQGGWIAFMVLAMRSMNGNERCDCTKSAVAGDNIENRFYYSKQHDVRVTFFLKYGNLPVIGRDFGAEGPPSHLTNESYFALGTRGSDWSYQAGELVKHLRSGTLKTGLELATDFTLIVNQGFWGQNPEDLRVLIDNVSASSPNTPAGSIFWKSTNVRSKTSNGELEALVKRTRELHKYAADQGWDELDVPRLTNGLAAKINETDGGKLTDAELVSFVDSYHFQPWVYNSLNAHWLDKLSSAGRDSCKVDALTVSNLRALYSRTLTTHQDPT